MSELVSCNMCHKLELAERTAMAFKEHLDEIEKGAQTRIKFLELENKHKDKFITDLMKENIELKHTAKGE